MTRTRVNIVTAVNSANVSRDGDRYTVRDVVHALDGIVLNGRMYPGEELRKSVQGLNGRPAPAGHPKDGKGRHISASNGEALSAAWIGAWCVNSRYEGGRAMCDISINGAQAKALPAGAEVLARLDAAIAGTNTEPIAVSSGLMLQEVEANGESLGKKYRAVATNLEFDHLAILLEETPAGTPAEGVGMFVNAAGEETAIEVCNITADPVDRRAEGFKGWIMRLLGNADEVSFDAISSGLHKLLPDGAYLREVFARYAIWTDRDGKLFRQDYSLSSDGSLAFSGMPVEVTVTVEYEPVSNHQEGDTLKDAILAALNAAGISTAGMDDVQALTAYNALQAKPVQDRLTAANGKLAEVELAANAAAAAELAALATELAANTKSLTADDFKAMGLARCKELKTNTAKAAPVAPGATGAAGDEFAGYSLNAQLEATK